MAVKIRLRRLGGKRDAFYRIVVADSRTARNGRFIEEIGFYDPVERPAKVRIDAERAQLWLGRGARPSETVRAIFARAGLVEGYSKKADDAEESFDVQLVGEETAELEMERPGDSGEGS